MSMQIPLLSLALVCSSTLYGVIEQYPESASVLDPRVPVVAPVPGGSNGKVMNVEADFSYALAPFVRFDGQGSVEAWVRDTPGRSQKKAIALTGESHTLSFTFAAAKDGRLPTLSLTQGKDVVASVSLVDAWGDGWKNVKIEWGNGVARLWVAGEQVASIPLDIAFDPQFVSFSSNLVDELKVSGQGEFSLDWEHGYAGLVTPAEGLVDVHARLFGFDCFAVSQEPASRAFPMLQLQNGRGEAVDVTFRFKLSSEVGEEHQQWEQTLSAGSGASVMVPIDFPQGLQSDVYHLYVESVTADVPFSGVRHFFHVTPRGELPGQPKFGLHDGNNRRFGYWPDAMGVDFAHVYNYWSLIMGPPWRADYEGNWGLDPNTPSEQWAWDPRVDWLVDQGLEVFLSLQSEPFLDWMRGHEYPEQRMKKYSWGMRGGFPNMELYRPFLRAFAHRYKGKVRYFEIENEPNHGGRDQIPPAEYAKIAQAVYGEIMSIIPDAQIYGICGTGNFTPWMKAVFEAGGDAYMTGVSMHTYVTPDMPEQADLAGNLSKINAVVEASGRQMPLINSETGTYVAMRESVDQPISLERLNVLIEEGTRGVFIASGWPNHAMTETDGGISIVRNAIYNFLAGAERFVFFAYNPEWPNFVPGQSWKTGLKMNDPGFSLISLSLDNERTPSWYTLAIGVLIEQLRPARLDGIMAVDQSGVKGAIFPTEEGGEVAVLWSPKGTRTVLLKAASPQIEVVSMLGKSRFMNQPANASTADGGVYALEVSEAPIYVHAGEAGLRIAPSPILNLAQLDRTDGTTHVTFTLVNRSDATWQGQVRFPEQQGWKFEPESVHFSLEPYSSSKFDTQAILSGEQSQSHYALGATLSLPDGTAYGVPVALSVRPSVRTLTVTEGINPEALESMAMPGGRLLLNAPEQAVVGRPPQLTSMQEDRYWQGASELSGEVKVAENSDGIFVYVKVTDSNARVPEPWPGVLGSAVELFFDLREPGRGLGQGMGEGVRQVVLRPALVEGDAVQIWYPSGKNLAGAEAFGGPTDKGYWVCFYVPWEGLNRSPNQALPIGFDVGLDGPGEAAGSRKSQLMLFGTASNNRDASNYGMLLPGK